MRMDKDANLFPALDGESKGGLMRLDSSDQGL